MWGSKFVLSTSPRVFKHIEDVRVILCRRKLDIYVHRTQMPPPSALSKMTPWLLAFVR